MITEPERIVEYSRRVYQFRHFLGALVAHDLRHRYRHSALGIAWAVARPLGMAAILTMVFAAAVHMPARAYLPFLVLSLVLWQFFAESLVAGCNAFRAGAGYLRLQPVPLAVFPLRVVLANSLHALVGLLSAFLLIGILDGLPSWPVLASALPGLAMLLFTTLALASLLGVLHVYLGDTQHAVELGLHALFFLSPILYRPGALANQSRLAWLIAANPLTPLFESIRRPLLLGQYPEPAHWLQAAGVLAVAGCLAWYAVVRCERSLVYWI
jgi:lipopolysaccharide transport system permease protein